MAIFSELIFFLYYYFCDISIPLLWMWMFIVLNVYKSVIYFVDILTGVRLNVFIEIGAMVAPQFISLVIGRCLIVYMLAFLNLSTTEYFSGWIY